eukprot:GHVH01000210.1.p1 GENE.GHVH01000210.1~~GHVH01000210.1.p1  ORF type:complete len:538 (+),score=74.17 GHVH01000210.1:679-2292(+)
MEFFNEKINNQLSDSEGMTPQQTSESTTFERGAGDFIKSIKLDPGQYRRLNRSAEIPAKNSVDLSNEGQNSDEDTVLEIKNCVGPVENAQPYLKGSLRIDRNSEDSEIIKGFCATDLRTLKMIHNRVKSSDVDSTVTEDSFDEKEWKTKKGVSSTEPDFRYGHKPSLVLLVLRKETPDVLECGIRRICHLRDHLGVNVLLEPEAYTQICDKISSGTAINALNLLDDSYHLLEGFDEHRFSSTDGIVTWKDDSSLSRLTPYINFGIVLGGDGTVLWTSLLFPKKIPPLLCVAMGSLGYLAGTKPEDCQKKITHLVNGGSFSADLRCRLEAYITDPLEQPVRVKDYKHQTGSMPHESMGVGRAEDDVLIMTVLNDIVISKASYGQLCTLDCHMNGEYFTTCSADGLIVATPTGSTAYNMSAGGSIVHPSVPAMLFTPICPHSLSFRPLVLPDNVVLSIKNPVDNRNPNPMIMCRDGFGGDELKLPPGYTVHIRVSTHPVPLIVQDPLRKGMKSTDCRWLSSLTDRLKWNYRKRQNGKML